MFYGCGWGREEVVRQGGFMESNSDVSVDGQLEVWFARLSENIVLGTGAIFEGEGGVGRPQPEQVPVGGANENYPMIW